MASPFEVPNNQGNVWRALSGLGAGLSGQGAQWQQNEMARQQQLSEERKRAAAEDVRRSLLLARGGNLEGLARLLDDRISAIEELGGDPMDTIMFRNMNDMALQGDEQAKNDLLGALNESYQVAASMGYLPQTNNTSAIQTFEYYQRILNDPNASEDQKEAARIALGTQARAGRAQTVELGGVKYAYDPNTNTYSIPVIEGQQFTAEQQQQQEAAGQQLIKFNEATGEQRSSIINDTFAKLNNVNGSINNIDRALNALNRPDGADTGYVQSMLPTVREASIELQNIRNQMGIDIVGATTFGALSESELAFALDTALPTTMEPEALKDWLQRKREAQEKLRQGYLQLMRHLEDGGTITSFAETMDYSGRQGQGGGEDQPIDDLVNNLLGGGN